MRFRVGVVVHLRRGKLGYLGYSGGVMMRDPSRAERWLVAAWNHVMCAVVGHDRTLEDMPETWRDGTFPCTACCKRLQGRGFE